MSEVYSDDFENEETVEDPHKLRLSIEFHSVKGLQNNSDLFVKFSHPLLGNLRTQSCPVRKQEETRLENAFQSQDITITKAQLFPTLSSNPLVIELWVSDKYTKDRNIGSADLQLEDVLGAPLRKTEKSVVRVLDVWLDILDISAPIGQVRVMLFLEDLGPQSSEVVETYAEGRTDYQVGLELEVWRKAEEAKWKSTLKEREAYHMEKAVSDWEAKENARETQYQSLMTEYTEMEASLRSKLLELQKREQKISALEDELKQKTNDAERQVAIKDEEVAVAKKTATENRQSMAKENRALEAKVSVLKEELTKAEEDLYKLRKEQESTLIQQLRAENSQKQIENLELNKRCEQLNSTKETFRKESDRLQRELTRALRVHEEEKNMWINKEKEELAKMRLEFESKKFQEIETNEIQSLKKELMMLKMHVPEEPVREKKPGRMEGPVPQTNQTFVRHAGHTGSELDRLQKERTELLAMGVYTEDDLLIQELNKQILQLTS